MSLMSAKKLLMQGARKIRPQDVFATSLYTGSGSERIVVNGLNMSGKGGLVWIKSRQSGQSHFLFDTARPPDASGRPSLSTNITAAESSSTIQYAEFRTNGFFVGPAAGVNESAVNMAAWSFIESKKFFDVVTYTGNGNPNGQSIQHGLGVRPGLIIVKRRDASSNWPAWHRGDGSTGRIGLSLNTTSAALTTSTGSPPHSATTFDTQVVDAGSNQPNVSGATYVAYVFAHNPDLIDCGSYVGNGSSNGPVVTCGNGWKPQWLMTKRTDGAGDWYMLDSARNPTNPLGSPLAANLASDEFSGASSYGVNFTASGFTPYGTSVNVSGANFVYLAIRSPT